MDRALRRYRRKLIVQRWLRRIRQKRRMHNYTESDQLREAVLRIKSHRDLRNHNRKCCSYCNPIYRIQRRERVLRRDLRTELVELL